MIRRAIERKLLQGAKDYPVVTVTGPRQSGKTTLVRQAFRQYDYVSLEEPDHRLFALEDPRGFLAQFSEKVILDEVQRAPDLFSFIQTIVDENDQPGQFILTGSQNFLLLEKVSQSLAGRCSILHLLPFSLAELGGRSTMSQERIGVSVSRRRVTKGKSLFDVMLRGFYPRIHDKNLCAQDWLGNYYQTYLERDVRNLLNVGDIETFGRFIRLCAGRTGQLLNFASLASDCGISHTSAKRWLSILEASFLVFLLRPHYRNFNKRLVKSPKMYFLDTGLLCYLLRIQGSDDLRIHALRGGIFESLVVSELCKGCLNVGKEANLYFWRDSIGHEIDILLDKGENQIPIEVKSGETVASDFLKGLHYWRKLVKDQTAPAALVYGGDRSMLRNGIPIHSWREL